MSNTLFVVWPCHKIYHLPSAIGGVKGMDWVRKVMRKIPRCIDIYCHSIFGFEILFCILFAERILKCMCWKKCINPDFPAKMHWIVGILLQWSTNSLCFSGNSKNRAGEALRALVERNAKKLCGGAAILCCCCCHTVWWFEFYQKPIKTLCTCLGLQTLWRT